MNEIYVDNVNLYTIIQYITQSAELHNSVQIELYIE